MAQKACSLPHAKRMCKCHVVSTPKHRRKVIYNQARSDLGEIFRKLCQHKGMEIIEGHRHVHMLLAMPPKYSVSSVMGHLKGKSSLMIFDRHAEVYEKHTGRPSYACELYRRLRQLPEQIMSTVIARAVLALQSFDTPEMRKLTGSSGFDLCSIASTPTVLFVRSSDTDRSADTAVSIIITQLFDSLFSYADHCENKQLPIPVRFVFDDFAALPKIQDFEGLMPAMHSRRSLQTGVMP